jgi:transposase
MNPASKVLAQVSSDEPTTWAARAEARGLALSTYYHQQHGRPSKKDDAQLRQYLTVEEEKALVAFLLLMSSFGQPVRIKYVPTLAYNIARRRSSKPVKPPGKNWPRAFEKRHPKLKAKRVRAIDWKRHEIHIHDKIREWFEVISEVINDPAVRPENVYNMDETGVMLSMLGSVKVLVGKDDLQRHRGAGIKRTMVTAIECISADGRSLLPLIIWPAATHRSNWTTYPTPGWHYGLSENGYNDSKISLEWLKRVFDAQTKDRANGKPRVLICDGFGTHETLEILEFCLTNNIKLCRLPSHTSHKTQPCDVSVFATLKTAYRDEVERLNRGGIDAIGKEHFTWLYKPARDRAITRKNILAGWAATGLFPWNPERVLRHTPKPPVELIGPDAHGPVESSSQDEALLAPVTPTTPVTTEGLISLHNLIKQDCCASDERSRQRLQRRVQKLASAAKISIAKQSLLQDHNRVLLQVSRETQIRRKRKPIVLGRAKVMEYEDLEEAQAKRTAQEKAAAEKGKGKRGRKRKSPIQKEGEVVSVPIPKEKVARMDDDHEYVPWRAPTAQMY